MSKCPDYSSRSGLLFSEDRPASKEDRIEMVVLSETCRCGFRAGLFFEAHQTSVEHVDFFMPDFLQITDRQGGLFAFVVYDHDRPVKRHPFAHLGEVGQGILRMYFVLCSGGSAFISSFKYFVYSPNV